MITSTYLELPIKITVEKQNFFVYLNQSDDTIFVLQVEHVDL